MGIRFYNARILTMQDNMEIIEGELWTEKERISYIGPQRKDIQASFEREIDQIGRAHV